MAASPLRCAIYTRKSADERADSQLSTLERQRELCAAYIASQAGEGWELLPGLYDDGGYSGGNLKRPALTRLLAAVEAGEIDVIVVYKIDRLSRSLADFVGLVSLLERRGVAFVAITQSFDTRSSTGRLMLNVLLSFAQFERELTSDRLKDWFAGARARGLWHGPAPYGYRVERGHLLICEEQAEHVRRIYRRYPYLGSARLVADECNSLGALNTWRRPINGWQVIRIIRNRLYRGELPHKGEFLPGIHEPIVTEREWIKANRILAAAMQRRRPIRPGPPIQGTLKGLLYDRHGWPMVHLAYQRAAHTHRYYVPSRRRYGPNTSPADRYRAAELEQAVLAAIDRIGGLPAGNDPAIIAGALRRLVERITVKETSCEIELSTGAILTAAVAGRVSPTRRTTAADPSRLV